MQQEIPLRGGNVSTVVRVGNTVRRNTGPWTPSVHALLRHLERVGFTGAPRVLGVDEHNREVLSYVEGECGSYPLAPHWGMLSFPFACLTDTLRGYKGQVSWHTPRGFLVDGDRRT